MVTLQGQARMGIEEKNPLKQGLKHDGYSPGTSPDGDWREESIKTRIETEVYKFYGHAFGYIEEKNPLKQGLKPSMSMSWLLYLVLKRRIH